jgi:hypothetical protein
MFSSAAERDRFTAEDEEEEAEDASRGAASSFASAVEEDMDEGSPDVGASRT